MCWESFTASEVEKKEKKSSCQAESRQVRGTGRFPGLLRHGTVREGARQAQDEGLKPPLTLGVTGRLWDEN